MTQYDKIKEFVEEYFRSDDGRHGPLAEAITDYKDIFGLEGDLLGEALLNSDERKNEYINKESLLESLDIWESHLRMFPVDVQVWRAKAIDLMLLDRYSESLEAIARAISLNPNDGEALYIKGRVLIKMNRHVEALKAYEQGITVDPNCISIWLEISAVYILLGMKEEASAVLDIVDRLVKHEECVQKNDY